MAYIIETQGLCKEIKRQKINEDITIHIERGSIYGLLGPNGAGKSTLMKMLTGMQNPSRGQILFEGRPWERKDLWQIGALIEGAPIYENLTAKENLKVRTLMYNLPERRIDEVLEMVKLADTGKKKAGQFSLGMKQRLGIAIALLNEPKLLILDEPTNGLDPIGISELRDMIRSFQKEGMTVMISSHALTEIEQVADHIGIIVGGKLWYEHSIEEDQDLERLFMDIVRKAGEIHA